MRAAALLLLASVPLAAAPAASARTYTVVIDKMKFGPTPAEVHRGDTIVWVNRDLFLHSATAQNHSFDVNIPAGKAAKTVMKTAGAIPFVCKYHPGMRGVLTVKP
jgi:plastocyanin